MSTGDFRPVASRRALALASAASALLASLAPGAAAQTMPGQGSARAEFGTIDVIAYGASGNGVDDDAPAINRAFDEARRRHAMVGSLAFGCRIVFPAGAYAVHASLNLTGLQKINTVIDGQGSVIIGRCAGLPVVDALGSRWLTIRDLWIAGDEANVPSIGLQIGRLSTAPGDDHFLDDVKIVGGFTFACLYNRGSETSAFQHMLLRNDQEKGFCLVQDGMNHFNIASPYAQTTLLVGENVSFNENLFINCDFLHLGGGTNVWLGDTARHEFIRCYSATRSGPAFIVYCGANSHSMLDVDCHCETAEMADVFLFDGIGATSTITGFSYKDHDCFANRSVLNTAPGVRLVVLENMRLEVARVPNPACRIFKTPELWRATGSFYSASPDCWNPCPGFQGIVSIGNSFRVTARIETVDLDKQGTELNRLDEGRMFRDRRTNKTATWTGISWIDAMGETID